MPPMRAVECASVQPRASDCQWVTSMPFSGYGTVPLIEPNGHSPCRGAMDLLAIFS